MAAEGNGDPPIPDLRTMEELCQPSLNGWGGPIALIAIQAMNFGLKNDMIQQSIKVNGVTDDALCLYLFSYSLTHHATAWFDRLPRNSINTFEQMGKLYLGKYFPPSMVTKLINEITNFRQRPDESLFEAWECYKFSIDQCPNHNMSPVTQIDTFYNGLTLRHRDTINAAAGGTFMKRHPKECYDLIENMTAHHNDWELQPNGPPLAKPRTYMLREPTKVVILTNLKGASHGQNPPPAYQALGYQALVHQPPIPQPQVVTTNEFTNFMKANDAILKNMQTNMTSLTNSNLELKNMFAPVSPLKPNLKPSIPYPLRLHDQKLHDKPNDQKEKFFQIFKDLDLNISFADALILMPKFGPTIKSLLNYKDKLSEIARTPLNEHCSTVLLKKLPEKLGDPGKFLIPCDFSGMDECLALADHDASINLMPLSVWNKLSLPELSLTCMTLELADHSISYPVGVAEDVFVKTERALIDVFEGELVGNKMHKAFPLPGESSHWQYKFPLPVK
nr:reverse transcriptase domain-containing protein [Tanacetum cinerariifolium]